MTHTVATAERVASLPACSVSIQSTTKVFAEFPSVSAALECQARDLPSGSIVVDAVGRIRATLERHWNSAGTRQSPVWVLVAT